MVNCARARSRGPPAQHQSLPAPDKRGGLPLMQALAKRRSSREFTANRCRRPCCRPALGRVRRKPPRWRAHRAVAINAQEIDVYVALPGGAYLYDAKAHTLQRVAAKRPAPRDRLPGLRGRRAARPRLRGDHARMRMIPVGPARELRVGRRGRHCTERLSLRRQRGPGHRDPRVDRPLRHRRRAAASVTTSRCCCRRPSATLRRDRRRMRLCPGRTPSPSASSDGRPPSCRCRVRIAHDPLGPRQHRLDCITKRRAADVRREHEDQVAGTVQRGLPLVVERIKTTSGGKRIA